MKQRKIYWRRKEGKIIAEGKTKNKTIYLFTLPSPEIVAKSSLFTMEKVAKTMEKINRLDYKDETDKKEIEEVRTINIIRTPKEDDFLDNPDEIIEDVVKSSNQNQKA